MDSPSWVTCWLVQTGPGRSDRWSNRSSWQRCEPAESFLPCCDSRDLRLPLFPSRVASPTPGEPERAKYRYPPESASDPDSGFVRLRKQRLSEIESELP